MVAKYTKVTPSSNQLFSFLLCFAAYCLFAVQGLPYIEGSSLTVLFVCGEYKVQRLFYFFS